MRLFIKKHIKLLAISYDILSIPVAWYLAYWVRDNMQFLRHLYGCCPPGNAIDKVIVTCVD